jgi:hypothetical protein
VLCSVDIVVICFGTLPPPVSSQLPLARLTRATIDQKTGQELKCYEYSSGNSRAIIQRYQKVRHHYLSFIFFGCSARASSTANAKSKDRTISTALETTAGMTTTGNSTGT